MAIEVTNREGQEVESNQGRCSDPSPSVNDDTGANDPVGMVMETIVLHCCPAPSGMAEDPSSALATRVISRWGIIETRYIISYASRY